MMSGSATGGPRGLPGRAAGPELISSVSFNPLSLQALDRQRLGHGGRCLINRRDAQDRGDALDDARLVADTPLPDVAADATEAYRRIQAAFARLPRRQREVFALRQLEGLSTAATAAALRLSEGSVKRHLYRAVGTLRRALRDREPRSSQLWST